MGIASLVLGIVSLILGFVPFVWMIAFIPALVGLILGIISLVKKKRKAQSIVGIVLSAITLVLVILAFVNLFRTVGDLGEILKDYSSSTEENILDDSFLNTEEDNTDKLKENITAEALGITSSGDFAFKITNNNDKPVYLDYVNVIFKDANGNFALKENGFVSYFSIPANSEVVNYVWGYSQDYSQYPIYEFDFQLSESWSSEDMLCENFEVTSNNTGSQIAVEVKNNNNVATRSMNVVVAYYQGDKIVGVESGDAYEETAAGGTAYVNVDYPTNSRYQDVTFDKYEVYLLGADEVF